MNRKYNEIMGLPHHVSKTRSQMPMSDRAAQFAPFAALTGYDSAIKETGRLTDERLSLIHIYFKVDVNYLLTEDEEFVVQASEQYGSRGMKPVSYTHLLFLCQTRFTARRSTAVCPVRMETK